MKERPNTEGYPIPNCQYSIIHNIEATTQICEGDTFGNLSKINHMFGSLGLNLTYEGILLGLRVGGPKRSPQFSITARIGLQKYKLTASPSFFIALLLRAMEA
jgi:hypothetical protein